MKNLNIKNKYQLGTIEASEHLIKDLYINLRNEVNAWSKITQQTPQARMGYIGQHLVSVVTGFPGGKSGARGYDLVLNKNEFGEIKTCYRVDQLGACKDCGAVVSSLEKQCSMCGSNNIDRKDDSKWLIGIEHEKEFSELLDPKYYYFVLFEFEDIKDINNGNIIASIWQVNPKNRGFAFCMIDYYYNIRSKSASHAPFNMWPHMLKFALTQPVLIYKSKITDDGKIETEVFPTKNNTYVDELLALNNYSSAKTLTPDILKAVANELNIQTKSKTKNQLLLDIESFRVDNKIKNSKMCDVLSNAIYLPLIKKYKKSIPQKLKSNFTELR